ncbi:MAG: hypothetical protein HQK76_04005 [Desulfobacterales bacterium]|nr:hypothetical protein [Desulfobacterales bacterium]
MMAVPVHYRRDVIMLPDFLIDIQIETEVLPYSLAAATSKGVLWQATQDNFLLEVPEVCRYLVKDGRRIVIDAAPDADSEKVVRFLRMTPLAALLYQRSIPTFHAAAAVKPDTEGCVLLAGDSITGKSVLLSALLQRGWWLLSDDLSIVDLDNNGQFMVYPTFPEVILWQDAVENLELKVTLPLPFRFIPLIRNILIFI